MLPTRDRPKSSTPFEEKLLENLTNRSCIRERLPARGLQVHRNHPPTREKLCDRPADLAFSAFTCGNSCGQKDCTPRIGTSWSSAIATARHQSVRHVLHGVSMYPTHHAEIFKNSDAVRRQVRNQFRRSHGRPISLMSPPSNQPFRTKALRGRSWRPHSNNHHADFHCQSDHVPCHSDAEVLGVQRVPAGFFCLPRFFCRSRRVWLPTAHL